MKKILQIILLILISSTSIAQQRMRPDGMGGWVIEDTSGCGGLFGAAQGACLAEQQNMQQQQIWQQQIIQQQQIENQRLQNEILRNRLEQEQSARQPPQIAPQVDNSKNPEFLAWQSENQWFGKDKAKTEFALLYAKQLRQDRPDLLGRPFFDAVTVKVNQTFGTKK